MKFEITRRSFLAVSSGVSLLSLGGCFQIIRPVQPYGDLIIENKDDNAHKVTVIAANRYVKQSSGEKAATARFSDVVGAHTTTRKGQFFSAGDTDVSVAVDGTRVEETKVRIVRGEGGDKDRHEESLNVNIRSDGSTKVTVKVTHTPPA